MLPNTGQLYDGDRKIVFVHGICNLIVLCSHIIWSDVRNNDKGGDAIFGEQNELFCFTKFFRVFAAISTARKPCVLQRYDEL